MKIAIVGWGVEGQSAFSYYGPEHTYFIVSEEPRTDFPAESDKIKVQSLTGDKPAGITGNVADLSYLDGIEAYDLIIYTPTSRKNLEQRFGGDQTFWSKAKTALQIFFETVQSKNIIGVTGTKGKGTTSTLITKILEASGKNVYLGGNIGTSVLDFVRAVQPNDWVVLELSSFQLYRFPYSPHIAVCLTVVPEHLDWHADVAEYVTAKGNIFTHQTVEDIAVYFENSSYSKTLAAQSAGKKIPYYAAPGARLNEQGLVVIGQDGQQVVHSDEIKLLGGHNLQNVCAATTAVWQVTQDVQAIRNVLTTFTGLEHRLELVRELDGVRYYDDTFSTNPDTTIVALESFDQPKVVILGGIDKGLSFEHMAEAVARSNVRQAIVIGDVTDKIVSLLHHNAFTAITTGLKTMPDIVQAARSAAQAGDVVLLSPGSSSFDMFKDYKDRGNQFKQAVQALA